MAIERADLSKCIGCKMCINICPMDVFRYDPEHKKSIIAYPENCAGCGQCWYFCPADSLKMSLHSHMFPLNSMRAATDIDENYFDCTAPDFRERISGKAEPVETGSGPVTRELPIRHIYESEKELKPEYTVDVLVIGGGFAGVNAAYMAKKAGADVMLVDKGRPGFSGQSAWPGTFHFVDPDMGDDIASYKEQMRLESDGMGNMGWIDIFIKESKQTYERMKEWGIFERHPRFCETEYWGSNDSRGYRKNIVGNKERRLCFTRMLDNNDIPWHQHVMITKVVVAQGRCTGAIGFQTTTGKVVKINARSVVLACGAGAVGNGTYCVGGNTFDGEYMAYQMGLPVGGVEYEDFHSACSFASGNAWINADTSYLDNIYLCGGWYGQDAIAEAVSRRKHINMKPEKNGVRYLGYYWPKDFDASMATIDQAKIQSKAYGKNPDEIRTGKYMSPRFHADTIGAAIGLPMHLAAGIYCGMDDYTGFTGIPGLYCAGDGIQLTQPSGTGYYLGNGSTSCFVSICGARAGGAAAEYAGTVSQKMIPPEDYESALAEIEAPLKLGKGFDPNWARDVLMGIMAPYWVSQIKTEETLKAALVNVEYMRDNVAPNLCARTPHGQRLCLEMQHKILACELKLRASLERKESREISFYREDYPESKDEYRGYILLQKGTDNKPDISFVKTKEEWQK